MSLKLPHIFKSLFVILFFNISFIHAQSPNDAGLEDVRSPGLVCTGSQVIEIVLKNYGSNQLDSVIVNWSINGTLLTPVKIQSLIDTSGGTGADSLVTPLGLVPFSNGLDTVVVWTSLPNGSTDSDHTNDTMIFSKGLGMTGTYTIGASGDFQSFNEAVDNLTLRGVCGPVTINVAAGTYNESIDLSEIVGMDAVNTVKFDGANVTSVNLTSSTNAVPTIAMTGGDYFTFSNLTISHDGTADVWGVHLTNGSDHNTIENCNITLPISNTTDFIGIVASNSYTIETSEGNNANYLTISDNTITGGERGIHLEGAATENVGNTITDNLIQFADDLGIGMDEQDSIIISGNTIVNLQNAGGDGMLLNDITDVVITYNTIEAPDNGMDLNDMSNFDLSYNNIIAADYGIDVDDANDAGTPTSNSTVINNMIKSTDLAGITWDDSEHIDLYHNTIYGNPALHFNDNDNMNLINNILVADGDYALEIDDATATQWNDIDYNIYHNDGTTDLLQFGTDYVDLAAWQAGVAALPQASSLEGDPNFYSSTDLHIIAGIASDAGMNITAITDDIDGDTRPFAPSTTVDIGADEFLQVSEDAGVTAIENVPFACPGLSDLIVRVANFGDNVLTGVTVNWNIDDGTTPITGSQAFTGLSVQTGKDTILNVASINYTSQVYDVTLYTTLPNGVADGQVSNDTLFEDNLGLGMNGTYTIGSTGDFIDFNDAVQGLVIRGMCGPVVFNVNAGTYNESVSLPEIIGNSSINTITFKGVSSSSVILTSSVSTVPTFAITGTDYVTISNITVEHSGIADVWGIHLMNGSDHVTIDSCNFNLPVNTTTDMVAIVASGSYTSEATEGNNANYLTISNNSITGGEIGIHLEGAATENVGNSILNNIIDSADDLGISMDEQDSITISGNIIQNLQNSGGDGMLLSDITDVIMTYNQVDAPDNGMDLNDMNNFDFSYNTITAGDFGMDVDDANDLVAPAQRSTFVNNMIRGGNFAGVSWDDAEYINSYHNTVIGNPALHFNDNAEMDLVNNIMIATNDYALEIDDATAASWDSINNNIYNNDGTTALLQFGVDYTDLVAWRAGVTAFPQSLSLEGDPGFVSATDMHVRGSLADDAGANWVAIADDIDGETRPMTPSTTVDIGADEFSASQNDLASLGVLGGELDPCGNPNQSLQVVVENVGQNPQSNVLITVNITSPITATLLGQVVGPLNTGERDTITLTPTINTFRGGTFVYQMYHSLTPDDYLEDDTLISDFTVGGTPEIYPVDTFLCSGDSVLLKAQADRPITTAWYLSPDDVNDTIPLGIDSLPVGIVTANTTFWVAEAPGAGSSVIIVEVDKGNPDAVEIQNVGTSPVDVTGWTIAVSDNYGNINAFQASTPLAAIMAPGDIIVADDNSGGPNYIGGNILWNPGAFPTYSGWAMIIDAQGKVVDYVAMGWPQADIYGFSATINGFPITITSDEWVGNGIGDDEVYVRDNKDDHDLSDWVSVSASTIGTTNPTLNLPIPGLGGSGCPDLRVPYQVLITPEPVADFTFTRNGNEVTFTNTTVEVAGQGPYTYSWDFGDGNTSTLKDPVHTYASTEDMFVTLEANNKCEQDTASSLITGLGIASLSAENVQLYPNPTQGMFVVSIPQSIDQALISVRSIDGKDVVSKRFVNNSGSTSFKTELDISNLDNGVYFMNIEFKDQVITKRVVLVKE